MKKSIRLKNITIAILLVFALGFLPTVASAESNTSQLFTNGVVTDGGANFLFVGDTGPNNYLEISHASGLTNVTYCYLGNSAGANHNTFRVADPGSVFNGKQNTEGFWIGNSGAYNLFIVTNGAAATIGPGFIGRFTGADYNSVVISGSSSVWSNDIIYVGWEGSHNSVTIEKQGRMVTQYGGIFFAYGSGSSSNTLTVSDPGSAWITGSSPGVGWNGSYNQMIITNGGLMTVRSVDTISVGYNAPSTHNAVVVTGAGSEWDAGNCLYLGNSGANNRVDITDGGYVYAGNLVIGANASSTGNVFTVDHGSVLLTNAFQNATLVGLRGAFILNSGTVNVQGILFTNALGTVQINGGWLTTTAATVSNGVAFTVGNGVDSATLVLTGPNNTIFYDGLVVATNSTLAGSGTITGSVTVYGALAPGNPVGTLTIANNLVLAGSSQLDCGLGTSSDHVAVAGNLDLSGTLNVTDVGGFGVGTYTLLTYTGTFTDNGLAIGTTPDPNLGYQIDTSVAGQVRLIVTPPPDLRVTPATGVSFTGPTGGPFTPASQSYTLQNTSGSPLTWTADSGAAWNALSAIGGTLSSGASTTVVVTITGAANGLAAGVYSDTIGFTNLTSGSGNTARAVSLTVTSCAATVTTSALPAQGGTTIGDATVNCGSNVTVSATANGCYQFVNWTEGGVPVSTLPSYTFTASGNRTLVANFVPANSTITTSTSGGDSTSPGSTNVTCGTSFTATATPDSCHQFMNWTEGGVPVSSFASYTFTVAGSRNLVANFSQNTYTIAMSPSPSNGGTTTGGGVKACGTNVTVSAAANVGFTFANWTENGAPVSSSTSYSFSVSSNRTLVAHFNAVPVYTVSASAAPVGGGTTIGSGSHTNGTSATVVASAAGCYSFVNWTEGSAPVSTSASYTFSVSSNRTLVANFTPTTYTISTSASPSDGGSTSGDGIMTCGTNVTVVTAANDGYSFVNWTENGTQVSTLASYSFTTSGNRNLVANFAAVGGPSLGVSETEFVPVVTSGQNAGPASFMVWNAGGGSLSYVISTSSNASWLAVSPLIGSSASATNTHHVSYTTASLSNGTYEATITISSAQAATKTIGVTLYVASAFDQSKKHVSLNIKVNFAAGKLDTATLKGALDLPTGVSLNNVSAQLSIGHVTLPFTLTGKGSGRNGLSMLKLQASGKPAGSNQLCQVRAKLKGDYDAEWAHDGLVNATTNATITVPVLLLLESNPPGLFYAEEHLQYNAKGGKSGTAK